MNGECMENWELALKLSKDDHPNFTLTHWHQRPITTCRTLSTTSLKTDGIVCISSEISGTERQRS